MNKNIVIVDIDGTISKVGTRIKYLKHDPIDWDAFYNSCFEDEPIYEIIELVKILDRSYDVYFCTGRRESVREITLFWLNKYLPDVLIPNYLFMRQNNDFRHDTEVKPELLKKAGIKLNKIAFILEDRDSMVAKWRELGVKCLQVAPGDF